MDIKSSEERSKNMARIKSSKTKPELYIRSMLHRSGFRFRVNFSQLPGKPDIYFTRKKVAVFIHGCFWHRHSDCKFAYIPKSNIEFWIRKFDQNLHHDQQVYQTLKDRGVRVIVIWECTVRKMIRDKQTAENVMIRLAEMINQNDFEFLEIFAED